MYTNEAVYWAWGRGETSSGRTDLLLPPALAALKPQQVRFFPPALAGKDGADVPVVHIKVFGMHSTGGHSTPYYGLEIFGNSNAGSSPPVIKPGVGVEGEHHFNYKEVSSGIYETY